MKIEQHVVTLELSKKLKELGFPQDCAFFWCRAPKDFGDEHFVCVGTNITSTNYICAAPLASELGDVIGTCCNEWAQGWNDSNVSWHFQYGCRGAGHMIEGCGKYYAPDEDNYCGNDDEAYISETNARADFLIHLLELRKKHAKEN